MGLSLALSFPEAEVVLAEQSEAAAALAYENAQGFGLTSRVKVFVSDLFSALKDEAPFDLLVCNPPYVAFEDQESGVLEANVAAFEPHLALFSDDRGMGHVKRILKQWPAHAAKGALAVFELGFRHHSELSSFLSSEVEGTFCWVEDLSGIPRFLWLRHS
jgi:HemK-like putative methylase